jgi:hypothetical protein
MKKTIFLAILLLACTTIWGQKRKTNPQLHNITAAIKSEPEIVKDNAEKWFKDFYVENFFKDPYSYKLLKTIVTSKSRKDVLLDTLAKRINNINNSKFSSEKHLEDSRAGCQAEYDDSEKEIEKYSEQLKTETSEERISLIQKIIAVHQKYNALRLILLKDIDLYILEIEEKESLEKQLKELNPEQLNQIAYFEIRIDCYSKNSLGNEVLGRFVFPFTKNGPIGNKNGFDKVIQLNKE